MSLHTVGNPSPEPITIPTPPTNLNYEQRQVWSFIQEHGAEALQCSACGAGTFRRFVKEIWGYTEHVDLTTTNADHINVYGNRNTPEYQDDYDEYAWECESCYADLHYAHQPDLIDLLNDIDKELY